MVKTGPEADVQSLTGHAGELPEFGDAVLASDGVDLTVIRWMLSLTPAERLAAGQAMVDLAASVRVGEED